MNRLGIKTEDYTKEAGFLVNLTQFFGPFRNLKNGHTTAPAMQSLYQELIRAYLHHELPSTHYTVCSHWTAPANPKDDPCCQVRCEALTCLISVTHNKGTSWPLCPTTGSANARRKTE